MLSSRRTWAEVDLDALLHNYHLIRRTVGEKKVMAVVKADAYGHGDIAVASTLENAGADWFAVSNFEEAALLRTQGITRPILILGYTPPACAAALANHNITQAVYSLEYAAALNEAALTAHVKINCHMKLDTGMARIGFCVQTGRETAGVEEAAEACAMEALSCTGVFTHFSCADEPEADSDTFTQQQFAAFTNAVTRLEERGIRFQIRHCCNSAATLRFPQMHLDMVRAGVILYGLAPAPECAGLMDLQPAMRFYSTVTQVKEVASGTQVSYGRTYTAPGPRKLATVAVGYADGFRRNFSNKGRVILRGCYAPIIGRVCMDQMLIDVSDIPEAKMGDAVILAGEAGDCRVTFDDFARLNGTINYEEVCLVGRRVPRVYIKGGKECGVTNYLLQTI